VAGISLLFAVGTASDETEAVLANESAGTQEPAAVEETHVWIC
jgi:hypothetical protein